MTGQESVEPQLDADVVQSANGESSEQSDGPILELDGVSKIYETGAEAVVALNKLDLSIKRGEYVAVIGPSGSGKSTLMNIVGCLDIPTEGHYSISGELASELTEEDLASIRNRRIGFVFQQFNLLASHTAQRNVELPLMYAQVPSQERSARAAQALEKVGLGDRLDHRPSQLSGGQQQRVAVARALVTEPAIVLADEPTGNLDSISTEDVLDLFDELHAQGRTIVLITHEHDVAARAQRTLTIADGRIVEDSLNSCAEVRND